MSVLKVLGAIVGVIVLLIVGTLIAARFSDGPWQVIAGGPFTSGERYAGPEPDWSFVADIPTVEFQLLDPARSRTTWIIEHDGRIYIPSGYMTTWWGKIWKRWPIEAEKDGRAVLRVNGKLYDRRLVRLKQGPELVPIMKKISVKYLGMDPSQVENAPAEQLLDPVKSGYLWVFQLAPR